MATNAKRKETWATLSTPEKQSVCLSRFVSRPEFAAEELEKEFENWLELADKKPADAITLDRLLGLATNEELLVDATIEATQAARGSARAAKWSATAATVSAIIALVSLLAIGAIAFYTYQQVEAIKAVRPTPPGLTRTVPAMPTATQAANP